MAKNKDFDTCYKCGKPATSSEHVPAKCIFPEEKDLGKDYRKHLITVPSCTEHNQDKTEEDEFFMLTITPYVGNNLVGFIQNRTKINRAIKNKKPEFYNTTILKNYESVIVKDSEGSDYLFYKGKIDQKRMDNYVELMVSALFFHEFKEIFKGEIIIIYDFLLSSHTLYKDLNSFIGSKLNTEFEKIEKKGDNPEVFTYQFDVDKDGFYVLKITFFEGANIFILLHPELVSQEKIKEQRETLEWEGLSVLQEIIQSGDFADRLVRLDSYLKKYPPTTYYYSVRGMTEYKLKKYDLCEKNLLLALELDKKNVDALGCLAYFYHHISFNKSKAKHYYIRAIEAAPTYTNLRLNFAQFLSQKDNNEIGAKIQFEKIISYDKDESRAHNNLANYYRRKNQKRFKGKIMFHLEEAIRLNPSYLEAHLNYGNVLQLNGEKEKSNLVLKHVRTLNDDPNFQKFVDIFISKNI